MHRCGTHICTGYPPLRLLFTKLAMLSNSSVTVAFYFLAVFAITASAATVVQRNCECLSPLIERRC